MTNPRYIHLHADYVHGDEADGSSVVALSQYIRRAREVDVRGRLPVIDVATYIARLERHADAKGEVVGHEFFCDGPFTALEVWRDIDAAARTKKGDYSKGGGRRGCTGTPRLAIFLDATLPRGISEQAGIAIAHAMARLIKARYGAAVEVACHKKDGEIDHCHFLIAMRRVDALGVQEMIRGFNGIVSRLGPDGVGEKCLSGHMEWTRATWARLLTEATGVLHDHRSYDRQDLDIEPLRHVPRSRVQKEAREGVPAGRLSWRQENALKLAKRSSIRLELPSEGFEPAGTRPRAPDEVLSIASLSPLIAATACEDLSATERELEGGTHLSPAFWSGDHDQGSSAQVGKSNDQTQMPSEPASQAIAGKDGVKDRMVGPTPTKPAASFKIVAEGASTTALDHLVRAVPKPPSTGPSPPRTDETGGRSLANALVMYGAALLKAGSRLRSTSVVLPMQRGWKGLSSKRISRRQRSRCPTSRPQ